MPEYYVDLSDLKFVLFDHNCVAGLSRCPRWQHIDRDTVEAILFAAERFATTTIAKVNLASDREGARYDPTTSSVYVPSAFHQIYQQYVDDGWLGLTRGPTRSGQDLPRSIHMAVAEIFFGACLSFSLWPPLASGVGHLVESYGNDELKRTFLPRLYSGEWSGSMCLTEACAGSDLGAIRTLATPIDGHFLVQGEKTFITYGEHDLTRQICHVVLARTPNAPHGIKGLSLFLVPKHLCDRNGDLTHRNDVRCTGIERKMGLHGAPTCTMLFGELGQCHGTLLGELNSGARTVFSMVNEIRLVVGAQSSALANAAYQQALRFAGSRVQGRLQSNDVVATTIIHHPDVRRLLVWQKAISEGIRALVIRTAYFADIALANDNPALRSRYDGLVAFLTPVCKAYASEMSCRSIALSIQTLGGYGYISDYVVEQLAREARVTCLFEGTNGIQALDLLRRKIGRHDGTMPAAFNDMIARSIDTSAREAALLRESHQLADAHHAWQRVTRHLTSLCTTDPAAAALHATPFLELTGDLVIGSLLLEQACLELQLGRGAGQVSFRDQNYWISKVQTAKFWTHEVLSLVPQKAEIIITADSNLMTTSLP